MLNKTFKTNLLSCLSTLGLDFQDFCIVDSEGNCEICRFTSFDFSKRFSFKTQQNYTIAFYLLTLERSNVFMI